MALQPFTRILQAPVQPTNRGLIRAASGPSLPSEAAGVANQALTIVNHNPASTTGLTGWTASGPGAAELRTAGGAFAGGTGFFYGGARGGVAVGAIRELNQEVTLPEEALPYIDAGFGTARTIWIQDRFSTGDDPATIKIRWRDGPGGTILSETGAGLSARSSNTYTQSGQVIPAGARVADIVQQHQYISGSNCNTYIDNIRVDISY